MSWYAALLALSSMGPPQPRKFPVRKESVGKKSRTRLQQINNRKRFDARR